MIYTYQRRKAMNQAVRSLYPDIEFYENNSGVPAMECYKLPVNASQIIDADNFVRRVREHCTRIDGMGMHIPDYGKALPVFILSTEIIGQEERLFYRVNYVNISEASLQKAEEYISGGKLYAVTSQETCNP